MTYIHIIIIIMRIIIVIIIIIMVETMFVSDLSQN